MKKIKESVMREMMCDDFSKHILFLAVDALRDSPYQKLHVAVVYDADLYDDVFRVMSLLDLRRFEKGLWSRICGAFRRQRYGEWGATFYFASSAKKLFCEGCPCVLLAKVDPYDNKKESFDNICDLGHEDMVVVKIGSGC